MNRNEAIEGINDKLKDLKYYAKEMGKVLKSTNYFIDELEKQAKKVEEKKYYLRLKKVYEVFLNIYYGQIYINYNFEENKYFISTEAGGRNYKTQFTEKEISEIKLPGPLTLDMFDRVEVKE